MKINIKRLIEVCEYNPERVGIALLKVLGYKVEQFSNYSGYSIYVYDSKGKLKFWR